MKKYISFNIFVKLLLLPTEVSGQSKLIMVVKIPLQFHLLKKTKTVHLVVGLMLTFKLNHHHHSQKLLSQQQSRMMMMESFLSHVPY